MDQSNPEIEIQAVNLAQQWYSLPHERLPELPDLLTGYLHCFSDPADRQAFLREAIRIAEEIQKSPKADGMPEITADQFRETLMQLMDGEQKK